MSTGRKSQARMAAVWRRRNYAMSWGSSTRCRLEAVGAQNPGDGAGGDPAAKPWQLSADALITHRGFSVASRTITVRT